MQYGSLKNNYFYQVQIILADIKAQTYIGATFLLGKIKDVMFFFLFHILGFHFLVVIKE